MRNMCQQKLKGWLIVAWDGKKSRSSWDLVYSFTNLSQLRFCETGGQVDQSLNLERHFCAWVRTSYKNSEKSRWSTKTIFFNCKYLEGFIFFFFPLNRPTGPVWTNSREVHISVYVFILFIKIKIKWRMTPDTWHMVGGGWTFSQSFSLLALTVWELWCCEDWEEKYH